MAETSTTPATLVAAISKAAPGDTLALAAGDYVGLRTSGVKGGDKPLIFVSADAASPARIKGTAFIGGEGGSPLIFRGIDFDVTAAKDVNANAVRVTTGKAVQFVGSRFYGRKAGDGGRYGVGIQVVGGVEDLLVDGCEFFDLTMGMLLTGRKITVQDNRLHDLGSDGIQYGGGGAVRILRNVLRGFVPMPGAHPDGIQASGEAEDVLIEGNLIDAGPQRIQGIFVQKRHKRLVIRDNTLIGCGYNAIAVNAADDLLIEGNEALLAASDGGFARFMTTNSTGRVRGNVAQAFELNAGVIGEANVTTPRGADSAVAMAAAADRWLSPPAPAEPRPEVIEITLKPGQRLVVTGAGA